MPRGSPNAAWDREDLFTPCRVQHKLSNTTEGRTGLARLSLKRCVWYSW